MQSHRIDLDEVRGDGGVVEYVKRLWVHRANDVARPVQEEKAGVGPRLEALGVRERLGLVPGRARHRGGFGNDLRNTQGYQDRVILEDDPIQQNQPQLRLKKSNF